MSENKILWKNSDVWQNEYQKQYDQWVRYNQDYYSAKGEDLVSE